MLDNERTLKHALRVTGRMEGIPTYSSYDIDDGVEYGLVVGML